MPASVWVVREGITLAGGRGASDRFSDFLEFELRAPRLLAGRVPDATQQGSRLVDKDAGIGRGSPGIFVCGIRSQSGETFLIADKRVGHGTRIA